MRINNTTDEIIEEIELLKKILFIHEENTDIVLKTLDRLSLLEKMFKEVGESTMFGAVHGFDTVPDMNKDYPIGSNSGRKYFDGFDSDNVYPTDSDVTPL